MSVILHIPYIVPLHNLFYKFYVNVKYDIYALEGKNPLSCTDKVFISFIFFTTQAWHEFFSSLSFKFDCQTKREWEEWEKVRSLLLFTLHPSMMPPGHQRILSKDIWEIELTMNYWVEKSWKHFQSLDSWKSLILFEYI